MERPRDPYAALQIAPDAEPEVVRAAYRALAQKYHPDVAGGSEARMTTLNNAWAVLRDPAKRATLDRERLAAAARTEASGSQATEWSASRPPTPRPARSGATVLDFGRYAGWSLPDIARQDPEFLEWLVRTPIGRRFEPEVRSLLEARAPVRPVMGGPPGRRWRGSAILGR
jgi:curved DNA-binding protein CbpA